MAYGARLESVLGASPRGFESPILRQSVFCADLGFSTPVQGSKSLHAIALLRGGAKGYNSVR